MSDRALGVQLCLLVGIVALVEAIETGLTILGMTREPGTDLGVDVGSPAAGLNGQ
jgi:hypothetical protein